MSAAFFASSMDASAAAEFATATAKEVSKCSGPKFIDIDLFFNGKNLPIVNRIGEKSEKLCSKFRRKHRQCLRFFLVGSGAKGRKSCRSEHLEKCCE